MAIIGCDLHSRYQQIAMLEFSEGEIVTRRLEHENAGWRIYEGGGGPRAATRAVPTS